MAAVAGCHHHLVHPDGYSVEEAVAASAHHPSADHQNYRNPVHPAAVTEVHHLLRFLGLADCLEAEADDDAHPDPPAAWLGRRVDGQNPPPLMAVREGNPVGPAASWLTRQHRPRMPLFPIRSMLRPLHTLLRL